MKTEKTILRADQPNEEAPQTQEHPQLHESPKNVLQSWHHLRILDQDLAETYDLDLSDDINKGHNREKRA